MKKSYHSSAEPTADAKSTLRCNLSMILPCCCAPKGALFSLIVERQNRHGVRFQRQRILHRPPRLLETARIGGCIHKTILVEHRAGERAFRAADLHLLLAGGEVGQP